MNCIACGRPGALRLTERHGSYGPSCDQHQGFAWLAWLEASDKDTTQHHREVTAWLFRRARADAEGRAFTEAPPKSEAERQLERAIINAELVELARELE